MRMKAEVISQNTMDGKLIPIKFRLYDEDGELQTFSIKGYKNLNAIGNYIMPNEVSVTSHMRYFKCKIHVLGVEKLVDLTYNFNEQMWYVNF